MRLINTTKALIEDKDDLPLSKTVFPYKTSFISLAGKLVNFKYSKRPFDDILLFRAETADNNALAIKYTRQYSLEAHILLSENGLAPKLHGFESIPGGWKMVVMEYIDESYQLLSEVEPMNREQFRDSIQHSVSLLHKYGFVHGDLRTSNILVSKSHSKALIIDFDAAGKAGEVVYPPNLNTADIKWPRSVRDGVSVTKEHDNYIFKSLFNSPNATRSRRKQPASIVRK
jgi:serine/threonine protein kinase